MTEQVPYFKFFENNLPNDFNYDEYRILYNLSNDKNIIINHYVENIYINNNHCYKYPIDFDINIYNKYNDLKFMNDKELLNHYIKEGCKENRYYKLPDNFDFNFYKKIFAIDNLFFASDEDIICHFLNVNKKKIYNVPKEFDIDIYSKYDDLKLMFSTPEEFKIHFVCHGIYENRIYKKNLDFNKIKFIKDFDVMENISDDDLYRFVLNNNLDFKNLPDNFSFIQYRILNKDLKELNNFQLFNHYFNNGIKERRKFTIEYFNEKFDVNEYKTINYDLNRLDNQSLINHFYIYGLLENRLHYKPKNINQKFIKNFYYLENYDTYINKYIGQIYTIHYEFTLKKFNYYFIYQYYKLENEFKFDINSIYEYIYKNSNKLTFYNSKQIIKIKPKFRKKFILVYGIHFSNQNIKFINQNIQKICQSENIEKIYIIYSIDNNVDNEYFIKNIIKIFKYNKHIDFYIKKIINIGYDCFKYYTGIYFSFIGIDTTNYHYILLNNSVNLINNLNEITEYFYNIDNEILSYTDSYEPSLLDPYKFKFHLQSFFFIMTINAIHAYLKYLEIHFEHIFSKNKSDNLLSLKDYIIHNIEINIYNYFIDNNINGISFISVDEFLPLFHLSLQKLNLCKSLHLTFRLENKKPVFVKYIFWDYYEQFIPKNVISKKIHMNNLFNKAYYEKNYRNVITKNIAFVVHIANENIINDYLNDISSVLEFKFCNFEMFITLSVNLISYEKKIYNFFKKLNIKTNIIIIKNKGADLGPFIKVFMICFQTCNANQFDFILKYHSKTDTLWRKDLEYPFSKMLYHSLLMLDGNNKCGGICSRNFLYSLDYGNKTNFINIFKRNNLDTEKINSMFFVGGTIFLINYNVISNFLSKINIENEYELLEETFFINDENSDNVTNLHCWERLLSASVYYEDSYFIGI